MQHKYFLLPQYFSQSLPPAVPAYPTPPHSRLPPEKVYEGNPSAVFPLMLEIKGPQAAPFLPRKNGRHQKTATRMGGSPVRMPAQYPHACPHSARERVCEGKPFAGFPLTIEIKGPQAAPFLPRKNGRHQNKATRNGWLYFGAPSGIRTPDTLLKRQVLYRLS